MIWSSRQAVVRALVVAAALAATVGAAAHDHPDFQAGYLIPPPEEETARRGFERFPRKVLSQRSYRIGRDRWTLERGIDATPNPPEWNVERRRYVEIRRNGRVQAQVFPEDHAKGLAAVDRLWAPTGFPVFVVQLHTEVSHGQVTRFYGVRGGKLVRMGDIEGECDGPVFRDFDGDGTMEWVFDDWDFIGYYSRGPQYYLVYKVDAASRLRLWRTVEAKGRKHLAVLQVEGGWDRVQEREIRTRGGR